MLISFEGGDVAGKSTHATLLSERLRKSGADVLLVREPGGTALGEKLRRILKGDGSESARAEMFLFMAARAELVECVIRPALERGSVVLTDRFADSTLAYQGYGRGIDLDEIRALNEASTGGLKPRLTVLLDVAPEVALARLHRPPDALTRGRGLDRPDEQRFEREPVDFHRRVAAGYRALAKAEPDRWLVIDAARSKEDNHRVIWERVRDLLRLQSSPA